MPQAHIAAAMGVSRRCVKKWIDRYATAGVAGLRDRSSRPHRSPSKTPVEVEQQVIELRRERRGPEWIGAALYNTMPKALPGESRDPDTHDRIRHDRINKA